VVRRQRPGVIIQDDNFDATESITLCVFTTDRTEAPLFRIRVEPSDGNGLDAPRSIMVDKVTTVSKRRLGARIGRLDDEDIVRLKRTLIVFLGLAGSPSS